MHILVFFKDAILQISLPDRTMVNTLYTTSPSVGDGPLDPELTLQHLSPTCSSFGWNLATLSKT